MDYVSSLNKRKNNYIQYQARKSLANVRGKGKKSSISLFNKNQNYELFKKAETGKKVISTIINENKSQNNISERGLIRIFNKMSVEKEKEIEHNSYANDQSINRSKLNLVESSSNLNEIQINKFFSQRNNINKDIKLFENKSLSAIDFNLFDYYCLRNITKKKTEIELFRFGFNFFKSQMDIVNFINIFILTQIMLTQQTEKKHNILSQTVELSIC